jgi:cellulose biosynthesis protein BcsQ
VEAVPGHVVESAPRTITPSQSVAAAVVHTVAEVNPLAVAVASEPATVRSSPAPRRGMMLAPRPFQKGERWQSLQAVLRGSFLPELDQEFTERKAGVIVQPSASGCGASTILATMARIFASQEESIALVDNSEDSLLPMYFGARSPRSGACTVFMPHVNGSSQLHILTPRPSRELLLPASGETSTRPDEWLERGMESLCGDYDRLLMKGWPGLGAGSTHQLVDGMTWLIPIIPDVRSALRMQQILDRFGDLLAGSGEAPHPYFVLNRFDANVTLHNDLRGWLKQRLNGQMLNFVIRRSDEVDESLAEGMTVVDYAPNSGVAEDFYRLAEWMQNLPAKGAR